MNASTAQQILDYSQQHILVVDDVELNRDMLSRRLKRKKFQVSVAADGFEALSMIKQQNFDLILLDIMMPGMSGLEVLTELRKTYEMNRLPIIMATAKGESTDVIDALKLGANDYVTKPLDFPVVLARVNAQLTIKQAHVRITELAAQLDVRNQFIKETFGRYLSDDIVKQVLESPQGRELGGKAQHVCIMMADLRGFSTLSDTLEPEQVVQLVNNFLSAMTVVIQKWQGTIIEFIGDAVLAIFGAPKKADDDALRAVSCALQMQKCIQAVNEKNKSENLPPIAMGIGLHTGKIVVGNLGSEQRTKYGIVGANVNLAARIESYTVGGQILISEDTANLVGDSLEYDQKFDVSPKGSHQAITLYSITGLNGQNEFALPITIKDCKPLQSAIAINFAILDGINVPELDADGLITHASDKTAIIESQHPVCIMANLKLDFLDEQQQTLTGQNYGKVVKIHDTGFMIHFSVLAESAEAALIPED